eukprot:7688542-Heterocapsa_arctica.AAC.1
MGVMGVHDCCLGVRVNFPGVPMFRFPCGAGVIVKPHVLRLDFPHAPFMPVVWRFHRCSCFLVVGRGINACVRVTKVVEIFLIGHLVSLVLFDVLIT